MMRSVRSGHGFSLILTDLMPGDGQKLESSLMPSVARTLRQGVGEGDFVARLQGSIFAAIVLDEQNQTAAEKADELEQSLSVCRKLDSLNDACVGEGGLRDVHRHRQGELIGIRVNAQLRVARDGPHLRWCETVS